jgi:integrase
MVNEKNSTPFGQRNFLNTLRAMFKWAVAEGRVPSDPTLGVTRQQIKSTGYRTWSESEIEQCRRRHTLGTMARVAIELLLSTAARRGDAVKLGPQHVHDGTTVEYTYAPGETRHETYGAGEYKVHDLENLGNEEMIFNTIEFLDSANKPLPVPDTVRFKAA